MPLSFRASTAPPTPLPKGFGRTYLESSQGTLEIIAATPVTASTTTPLFFVHGGFGSAAVWFEYMRLLSSAPYHIPCYAISLRGHGASWKPGYLRMTFGTTKRMLADDLASGVRHVESLLMKQGVNDTRVVLVAHSNGGGLSQLALNDGLIRVKGLALLDATPPFGLLGVYWNWLKADPWFPLRVYPHLIHSRSPLSSMRLIKNVFFCDEYPLSRIPSFEALMSPFESLLWPMGMMTRFVSTRHILHNVLLVPGKQSVLIMAAESSRLMGIPMMKRMADEYESTAIELLGSQSKDEIDSRPLVSFAVVRGGHHLQNDLEWAESARELAEFFKGTTDV